MTHGKPHGKICAADDEFMVQELWENFLGDHCPSLIGKPKLFFIQACRGSMSDLVICKPQPKFRSLINSTGDNDCENFVIPSTADLLVMFSSSEDSYAFHNDIQRSCFIQALCEELRVQIHEDLMTLLTGVNKQIAFSKQSNVPVVKKLDASKVMPSIMSTLTKKMFFDAKKSKTKIEIK